MNSGRGPLKDHEVQIKDMIEQVLFTQGLIELVFAPNNVEIVAATQALIRNALQQQLGDLIQVEGILIETVEESLHVTIQYTIKRNQKRHTTRFTRKRQHKPG